MKYSNLESRALRVLRRRRHTTAEVASAVYGEEPPHHASKAALSIIRSLQRKAQARGEPFAVVSSERAGPRPMRHWVEEGRQ